MIRQAAVTDLPALLPLAQSFYAQSRFLKDFDLERFVAAWTGLIESGVGSVFLLLDREGAIRGALGGVIYPDINSGAKIATEFFWFVAEDSRGGGLALYRMFERWARTNDCEQIRMVHLIDLMPDKLERVYRHLGFVPAEVNWVKELL